ncbi:ASCH domain-containing protein [Arthrobacter sp. UYCu712]|uniref:ASCH domain-containing protein n=1 Tax=Arthrobacter sp. UYCu712 TaxID=3156340 RepID=UPI003396C34F
MKALTVKNPWAWSIINAGKDVENRSKPTSYRGQLYIHAAKTLADDEAFHFTLFANALQDAALHVRHTIDKLGYVLGTVDVVGCHHSADCMKRPVGGQGEWICSQWAQRGSYHWELANPRPLACPFPETGKLGLWNLAETP